MPRQHTRGVTEHPRSIRCDRRAEARSAGGICPGHRFHRRMHRVVDVAVVGHPTEHGLHGHLVGREFAERDVRRQVELVVGCRRLVDPGDRHRLPRRRERRTVRGERGGQGVPVGARLLVRNPSGHIEFEGVVADHARREHLGTEHRESVADHLHPARRHAVLACVVQRHDGLLEQRVQSLGLEVVATILVVHTFGRRNCPTVFAVGHLVPPPVEDRQVESAVERRLHPRRSARLHGTYRIVEPHVAACVDVSRHRDVVIGEEDDAVAQFGILGELHDLLDERLAAVVGRMRLTRDDELHRPFRIGEDPAHPVWVTQHQRQSLVGGRPSREADGQRVGVEKICGPTEFGVGEVAVAATCIGATSDLVD